MPERQIAYDGDSMGGEEVEVEHRAVEAADAAADGDGLMDCRDVAESDDRTRIGAKGIEVDAVEDTHGAVAAASAEDRIVVARPQVMVELCDALVIVAG